MRSKVDQTNPWHHLLYPVRRCQLKNCGKQPNRQWLIDRNGLTTDRRVVPISVIPRTKLLFPDVDQYLHQVGQVLEMPVQIVAQVAVVHDRIVEVGTTRNQIATIDRNLVNMALAMVGGTVELTEVQETEKRTRMLRGIGIETALGTDMVTERKKGATVIEIANGIATGTETGIVIVEMTRIVIGRTGKTVTQLVAMVSRMQLPLQQMVAVCLLDLTLPGIEKFLAMRKALAKEGDP